MRKDISRAHGALDNDAPPCHTRIVVDARIEANRNF
jgi:hypothetical protein